MILKTFIISCALTIVYAIFISAGNIKTNNSQTFWQENLVKVEDFYCSDARYSKVIVGSSLSAHIKDQLLDNTFNLGLTACSIFDGLSILKNIDPKRLPSVVLIESNYLLRDEKKFLVDAFDKKNPNLLKKYFPSFRENFKPLSLLASCLNTNLKSFLDSAQFCVLSKQAAVRYQKPQYKFVSEEVIDYKVKPDSVNVINHIAKLKEFVRYLESNNVKVIFFEMPVDASLRSLPKIVAIRESISKHFAEYPFILPPDGYKVSPADLEHLGDEDAIKYTSFLNKRVSRITENTILWTKTYSTPSF